MVVCHGWYIVHEAKLMRMESQRQGQPAYRKGDGAKEKYKNKNKRYYETVEQKK